MPTSTTLLTSVATVTADHKKGRRAVQLFRGAYDGAGLTPDRAQFLNENRAFPAALRDLIARCSMPVVAPKGGRIHIVRVPVDPGRDWQEAINAAGPDTGGDWAIRKVGDQYPPETGEPREREIILVNFGQTIESLQPALDWAEPYGLSGEKPRGVFAIGEHKPNLRRELGQEVLVVVSPVQCSFEGGRPAPCAWSGASGRGAGLRWSDDRFGGLCWFAFPRE